MQFIIRIRNANNNYDEIMPTCIHNESAVSCNRDHSDVFNVQLT